jgi:hypothetical protein
MPGQGRATRTADSEPDEGNLSCPILRGATVMRLTGPNKLILSWSSTATNLVIQTNGDLAGANWGTASYPVTITNGTNQSVTITPASGNMFFRLKQ